MPTLPRLLWWSPCCSTLLTVLAAFSLKADPELFQFGNHWPPFLKLARRSLNSTDPAIHAKVREKKETGEGKKIKRCQ